MPTLFIENSHACTEPGPVRARGPEPVHAVTCI